MELSTDHIAKHVHFRLVRPDDAEFILSLRLDKERSKYLSAVDPDVETQRAWITEYMKKEKQGAEYYFIIVDGANEDVGTVRLYDFRGDTFSWGSWILKSGAPLYGALESALLVYEIAFNQLGFRRCHCEVRKENTRTLGFHTKFGARITAKDDTNHYVVMEKDVYEKTRERYSRFLRRTGSLARYT